jgi:rare lipoprotein A
MHGLTAAHRTFPFGTKVRVTNLVNNLSVIVRINDRGPFVEGRIIDLSLGAATVIESVQSGTVKVRLEVLEWGRGQ